MPPRVFTICARAEQISRVQLITVVEILMKLHTRQVALCWTTKLTHTETRTRTQKHAHTAWTHPQTHTHTHQRAHMLFGHNRLMEQYVIDVPHLAVVNCVRPPLRGVLNGSDAFIRFELFMQYYTLQCSMQSMFVCNLFHDYHLYSICYFLIISESNMFRWLCT